MGCKWCSVHSGLGRKCKGPLGIDDLEVHCECDCHKCPDCGSAHCETMGGSEPCERDFDRDDDGYGQEWDDDPDPGDEPLPDENDIWGNAPTGAEGSAG